MRTHNAITTENYLLMSPEKREPSDHDMSLRLTNATDWLELTLAIGTYNVYSIRINLNPSDIDVILNWIGAWRQGIEPEPIENAYLLINHKDDELKIHPLADGFASIRDVRNMQYPEIDADCQPPAWLVWLEIENGKPVMRKTARPVNLAEYT